ncbi:MAG: saccharopine dehydrogenase NADP-binding domain-containing protein [Clostridiales bacterium]|nr:saccharopine dehydrogenase NADP-binding domain-containing protein [Clostridiales bacterium]
MINDKLKLIKQHDSEGKIRIMIIGLGSVGNYLLEYLLSTADEKLEIIVAGRNADKLQCDVNIARVAALIRRQNRSNVIVDGTCDLENVDSIAAVIAKYQPDFIVNTSRVYSGLKYGTISWKNVRAYGIWTPLSIKYIRNIMLAYEKADGKGVVINTSYSDGTIPWLKSAGKAYPDFGSGNLNHLRPRLMFAIAADKGISDFWNIGIDIATAHFHDVVISKEGQNEGVPQLISATYKGEKLDIDQDDILKKCVISMPTDSKRNMMNASSNFDIISCILKAIRENTVTKFYSPGVFGNIGGFPVVVDGTGAEPKCKIDDSVFALDEMIAKNRESLGLDGVEDIKDGCLIYTDALIAKAEKAFGVTLPKTVHFDEIDQTANFIIDNIINPALEKGLNK